MATATLVTATVKYTPREPKDYGNGPRINAVVTTATGEDVKVWGNADDEALKALSKKQSVQLLFDGKGYKLVETEQPVSTPTTAPQSTVADSDGIAQAKRAIASDITEMANLYGFCYGEAKRVLEPHGATTEGIQGCAFRLWHHAKDQGLSAP